MVQLIAEAVFALRAAGLEWAAIADDAPHRLVWPGDLRPDRTVRADPGPGPDGDRGGRLPAV